MQNITILIVDDNKEIVRAIGQELKSKNPDFIMINASNGETGVEVAKSQQPDLIIMDWDMPVMNGIEAIRQIKNRETISEIPIIMATGQMTSSEHLQIALEAGATDYIRKPIDFVELTARVNTALRIREQQVAIRALLESDIDLKNRKLSTTSMLIVEKNSLLHDFHQELREIGEVFDNKPMDMARDRLTQLRKRISNHLDLDQSWETFKLHFDEVNPRFFTSLKNISNDLSYKDQKLCAYIKLGMDNKQIARLLNISPGSARTSLYRLKKKLGIDQDENLRVLIDELE